MSFHHKLHFHFLYAASDRNIMLCPVERPEMQFQPVMIAHGMTLSVINIDWKYLKGNEFVNVDCDSADEIIIIPT